MDLLVEWDEPVELRQVENGNLVYDCDLNLVPEAAGIYVFARRYDSKHYPLYIGQAQNIRARIEDHFKKNVPLMMGVLHAGNGARVVMVARFVAKRGQQLGNALDVLEKAHIEYAVGQGHELLNKQGVKFKLDAITSTGKKLSYSPFPKRLSSR